MDDNMVVDFMDNGNTVLELTGSGARGADSYQLDLTHPIHVDEIDMSCNNSSSDCNFSPRGAGQLDRHLSSLTRAAIESPRVRGGFP
jgi:hypothetical protein